MEAPQAGAPARPARTWATGPELVELVRRDSERRGVRFYPQAANHARDLYDVLLRRLAPAGDVDELVISKGQLARDLYPDHEGREAQLRKKRSVANWIALLERVGLLARVGVQRNERGKDQALRLRLLPVPELGPDECTTRRRRETRKQRRERRVRPGCRITGQKGVNRYVTGVQADEPPPKGIAARSLRGPATGPDGGSSCPGTFQGYGEILPPQGSPPLGPRRGPSGGRAVERSCARTRPDAAQESRDTTRRRELDERAAALVAAADNDASRERAVEQLADLAGEGLALSDVACHGFRLLFGRPPLLGGRAIRELGHAAAVLRRCRGAAAWPCLGGAGADHVAAELLAAMADYRDDHEAGKPWALARPASAAFFVRRLRRVARRERSAWRDRRRSVDELAAGV